VCRGYGVGKEDTSGPCTTICKIYKVYLYHACVWSKHYGSLQGVGKIFVTIRN
jgi:hypothetical protein